MAELYEIAFAVESQRQALADAVDRAVHARQEQDRQEQTAKQERREHRERRVRRQDKHADVLKQPR